jgi:hypothetical protein
VEAFPGLKALNPWANAPKTGAPEENTTTNETTENTDNANADDRPTQPPPEKGAAQDQSSLVDESGPDR